MARKPINGFSGVGRNAVRTAPERDGDRGVVAAEDITSPETLARRLSYDTSLGRVDRNVLAPDAALLMDQRLVHFYADPDPSKLPWDELRVGIVVQLIAQPSDLFGAASSLGVTVMPRTSAASVDE
jgi:glyceraldehyde 3-phosphate dehydrogenase